MREWCSLSFSFFQILSLSLSLSPRRFLLLRTVSSSSRRFLSGDQGTFAPSSSTVMIQRLAISVPQPERVLHSFRDFTFIPFWNVKGLCGRVTYSLNDTRFPSFAMETYISSALIFLLLYHVLYIVYKIVNPFLQYLHICWILSFNLIDQKLSKEHEI